MRKLFSQIASFHKFATTISLKEILHQLSTLETFKDRIEYAEKHLEHLSSGSSRVIYVTPNKEVLKLAKNERGIAQNKVEADPKMKSKYINKTLQADKNGYWKISPYLDKITEKEFEKLTGVTFKDFGLAIEYGLKEGSQKKPDSFDKISKLDLYKQLIKVAKENDLVGGDLSRISSWGRQDDCPIVLDAGLSRDVYEEFYDSTTGKSKSSHSTTQ